MFKNEYWVWEGEIPKSVCEAILKDLDWNQSKAGTVSKGAEKLVVDEKIRVTDLIWQPQLSVIGSIAQTYIRAANINAEWNLILNGLEAIQLGKYSIGGHYDWHRDTAIYNDVDIQAGLVRKLSMSILLNDPSEFEGGELEIEFSNGEIAKNLLPKQGSIVVFPSFMRHRVSPTTLGTRYTAVTWANGPQFK